MATVSQTDAARTPWYTAVSPFGPGSGARWSSYVRWSNLSHLQEVVTLDSTLCPRVIEKPNEEDWKHNVHEDFLLDFFHDLPYLERRVRDYEGASILAALREPRSSPRFRLRGTALTFLGYDLLDLYAATSALTNCGGFPEVFDGQELSPLGLLPSLSRARQIQRALPNQYPDHPHSTCHVWGLWRLDGCDFGNRCYPDLESP